VSVGRGTRVRGIAGLFLSSAFLLVSCATAPATDRSPPADRNFPEAVDMQSPMRDVSLFPGEIPVVLLRATEAPYARPAPLNCATLTSQIKELDAALGLDLDSEAGRDEAHDTALSLLVSGIKSTIPYFGWIRRLTGADRRERRLLAAITAGSVRRGYLKGLGEAEGCLPPASPDRTEHKGVAVRSGRSMP
jgi:hypothetical protein